jgi:3-isopropylmalate/(R)-2-methylmalate dehydratase small subunit
MKTVFKGKVIVLGDNIDTDQIYPGRFLEIVDPADIGKRCFAGISEDIAPNFVKGDIVVAGKNFGCGSSREHAPISLINMGVSVVIADSFARIFFRNSINLGLPLIICKGINRKVNNGDEIEVNIERGLIEISATREILKGEGISGRVMDILNAGGIKKLVKMKQDASSENNILHFLQTFEGGEK